MTTSTMTTKNQYKCPSYYDNNNVLQDCECGKCHQSDSVVDIRKVALRLYDDCYKHGSQEDGSTTYITEKDFDQILTTLQQTAQQEKEELVQAIIEIVPEHQGGRLKLATDIKAIAQARGIGENSKFTHTKEVLMGRLRELKQKDSHIGIGGLYTADMEMAHNAALDQALQIIEETFKSE